MSIIPLFANVASIGSVEAEEEKTWLVVPMNGLGVPNYGGQDLHLARLGQTFAETSRQILQRYEIF